MSRRLDPIVLAAVALVAVLPAWLRRPIGVTLLNYIGMSALAALGLVLLTGVGGLTSFGQAAFVGIGAYATAWLTTDARRLALARPGRRAVLAGGGRAGAGRGDAAPVGPPAAALHHRLGPGDLLPVRQSRRAGPAQRHFRHSAGAPRPAVAAIGAGRPTTWCGPSPGWRCCSAANLLDSRQGRAIRALRGGTAMAESLGIDTFRVRLAVFVICGAVRARLSGWLFAHVQRVISPTAVRSAARASNICSWPCWAAPAISAARCWAPPW